MRSATQKSANLLVRHVISGNSMASSNGVCNGDAPKKNGNISGILDAKRGAAFKAVDENVKSGFHVGIGSGTTVIYVVERLANLISAGTLANITCVPSSFQARQLITHHSSLLRLSDLSQTPELDVYIDGADEIDPALSCIKGGGGCLTQEKIVMSCAAKFIVVCDFQKESAKLGDRYKTIPIEVVPEAHVPIGRRLERKLGGSATLRLAGKSKAGPLVTDNGNFIIDYDWPKHNRLALDEPFCTAITSIPGVVEIGLFVNCASKAYVGHALDKVVVRESGNPVRAPFVLDLPCLTKIQSSMTNGASVIAD